MKTERVEDPAFFTEDARSSRGRRLPLVNEGFCSDCGGACCKNQPGSAFPEDFGAPDRETMTARLREAFASGLWAIDWWEGDPREGSEEILRAFFVRPAHAGHADVMHGSWGGGPPCALLGPTGCTLAHDARPLGCRGLEPSEGGRDCKIRYGSKRDASLAWIPYVDVLRATGYLEEFAIYNHWEPGKDDEEDE